MITTELAALFIMDLRRAGAGTSADIAVLLELSDRHGASVEERTPSMISRALKIPKAQMSNIIKRLQRRALITRGSHPRDLRKLELNLSDSGRRLFGKYHLLQCPKTPTT